MRKSNLPITVFGDGEDAVIVIHGLLREENALQSLYANAGQIADAVLEGMVDAEPVKRNVGIDTSDVVFTDGPYKGMHPSDVIAKEGDKGYYKLCQMELTGKLRLAVDRELTRYEKERLGSQNPETFSSALTPGQCSLFLERFKHAIRPKMRAELEESFAASIPDICDYGEDSIKRMLVKSVLEYYQEK